MSMDKRHFVNALNGKEEIKVWNIKNEIFSFLRNYFTHLQYKEVVGELLEEVRTTSLIFPFTVSSKCRDQNYYLRVTLENALKQTTALTLDSTFALQSVFYDKLGKKQESPQTQTLEFVSLNFDDDRMIQFLIDYFEQVLFLAQKFNLEIPAYEKITVLQYSEALKYIPDFGKHHLKHTKLNDNLIVLNVPVESPYILEKDGKKVELQWYIHGHYVAHSYFDEVDYQKIANAIKNQAACQDLMDYNQMLYFNLGLPLTYSGGLGIERSLMYLLGLHHMISIQNPIGVDSLEKEYVRKLRRKKK